MTRIYPSKIYQFILGPLLGLLLTMPLFIVQENYHIFQDDIFTHIFFVSLIGTSLLFFYFFNKYKRNTLRITCTLKKSDIPLLMWSALYVLLIEVCFFSINAYSKAGELSDQPLDMYLIIASICIAPLMEELLFRQYFLSGLLSANKPVKAICINALLFGLFHIQLSQIILGLVLGLLFACVFCKTKNIANSIILHALANSLSFLLVYLSSQFAWLSSDFSMIHLLIMLFACLLLLLVTAGKLYALTLK